MSELKVNKVSPRSGTSFTLGDSGDTITVDGTNLDMADSKKIRLGTGNDLELFHDGNSNIKSSDGGMFLLSANSVQLKDDGNAKTFAKFVEDGACELYHNNSKKLETTANGVQLSNGGLGVGTDAGSTDGQIRATDDITAFYSSDVALKENIHNIDSPMNKVQQLNGVLFDWKEDYIKKNGGEDGYFVRKTDVGVIARDVEKVLPEVVGTRPNGVKAVKYDRLCALLIECVKDLQNQIDDLKDK